MSCRAPPNPRKHAGACACLPQVPHGAWQACPRGHPRRRSGEKQTGLDALKSSAVPAKRLPLYQGRDSPRQFQESSSAYPQRLEGAGTPPRRSLCATACNGVTKTGAWAQSRGKEYGRAPWPEHERKAAEKSTGGRHGGAAGGGRRGDAAHPRAQQQLGKGVY